MKIGKLPENVLVRSVLRQIKHRRPEVLMGPAVGQDCGVLELGEDEVLVLSADPITGRTKDMGGHSVHITVNDLAASGAEPLGLMLTVLLPPFIEEGEIRELMRDVEAACLELNVEVIGGHTEVTNVVNQPLLSVTGLGKVKKESLLLTRQMKVGQDIVVSKWIGLEATSILAKEKREALAEVFSSDFLDTAAGFAALLSVLPEARVAAGSSVSAMHDITEGGIFGALWEVAEGAGCGLAIDLKKIPIRQETVEICEFFGLNPYLIMSSGSMLMAADDGHQLVRELEQAGIPAAVIGKATQGNDRILYNGGEKRYLDRPQTDELYKIMG